MTTYTINELSNITNFSNKEINSFRKSKLISHISVSIKKHLYTNVTIQELNNIRGFEKLRTMFTKKVFKNANLNFQTVNDDNKNSLIQILDFGITSEERYNSIPLILQSTTSLEINVFERYKKYCNTALQTEAHYRLKFGDKEGILKYQIATSNKGEGNTLDGQIKKYGKEIGTKKHKKMNLKKAHTIENFIRIHGEEKGQKMFDHTMSLKGQTLNRMKKKYGDELGTQRFNEWKEKCVSTEENFIKRHGEEKGKKKWIEFKENSKQTKYNFVKRYGEEEGEQRYIQFCNRSANTKENFIRVHGIEKGKKRWTDYKNSNAGYRASKESLNFFEHITMYLLKKGFDFDDIFYGVKNSFEFKIDYNNKLFSYDYTILSLKLIFEYNGSHVHPSKEKLSDKEWNTWKSPWTNESADEKFKIDKRKIKVAENKGFTVIEIWDYENTNESLNKCINLIEQKQQI